MEEKDETKTKHHSNSKLSSNELSNSEIKSIYELIKLHEKFEKDAVRHYRKGYSSPREVDVQTNNPSYRRLAKQYFSNNDVYLQELLKTQGSRERKTADFGEKLSLRLPKLETIAPENKAIFYTALPVFPSAKKTEMRKHISSHKRQKRKLLGDIKNTFIQVRPLPSDEAVLSDIHAISQVRESNCTMGYDFLPDIDMSQLPSKLNDVMKFKKGGGSYRSSFPGATNNDLSTYKQYSKGVTQVKVTLSSRGVTQEYKDPSSSNKNRSIDFCKTPQNSPRNSLIKESLGTRKGHSYSCRGDGDNPISMSKEERKVHFSKYLTKVHRYHTVKNL